MSFKKSALVILFTVACFLVAAPLFGQATGALSGTVIDPAGAVVPGASAQRSPPLPHGEAPRPSDAEAAARDEETSLPMRGGPPAKGDER